VVLGVGGQSVGSLAELYRKMWARGPAGTPIPLDILQGAQTREVTVQSTDRASHLKLKRTF
jgi:serine protease Do